MNVVFDSNVIIDAVKPNPGFEADAKSAFRLIGEGAIDASVCANSLTDIFYILRKARDAKAARETIAHLITAMRVLPLTQEDCQDALALPMADFEDALIAVCAKKAGADCVVSRDEAFLRAGCGVRVVTPKELLRMEIPSDGM